jgi:hypothetical protein
MYLHSVLRTQLACVCPLAQYFQDICQHDADAKCTFRLLFLIAVSFRDFILRSSL